MFSFLWDFFVSVGAILALPRFFYRFRKNPALPRALKQKLGFGFPSLSAEGPVVWVHAVSVGEVKAVSALASRLKEEVPGCTLLVTTITLTGNDEAKKSIPQADHILFLPFDISFIMKRVLKKIRPSLLVITETDFWFHLVNEAKKGGAQVALVNGKISERSARRFKRFPFISHRLFSTIDQFLLQSEDYEERFLALGVPKEKISITGNLKLDTKIKPLSESEKEMLRSRLGVTQSVKTVVFASTHPGEEELAINLAKELDEKEQAKIVIVPRHPERFVQVAGALRLAGLSFTQISKESAGPSTAVVLVDQMGLLGSIYQITDIAVVCGSFTPIGGHNIIEPMPFNVPVLFGPHMFKQPEFTLLAQKYRAGLMIKIEELSKSVRELLANDQKREELGRAGVRLVLDNQGASAKTWQQLLPLLHLGGEVRDFVRPTKSTL
ncbi:3-deoxy-D-manno-octulosonic acid transferase [Estrella lausannensis]|uniref:3-deoxy-D-manno-octulosonic acid transferase n=1 Tax=Estrella lausannensis TaxID=483423 RepID=A0A0H5E4L2_9BACT|nr:3-deoxy-D-manno-octulosonic acid transferase [Estrella lausannensis]CRX38160.1 3-deoxy-D-manno-octulosonic-acid transferase [Estrella lausannensis]